MVLLRILAALSVTALAACETSGPAPLTPEAASQPVQQTPPPPAGDTVAVNRFIWNASLDVLSFLPIETVDPFTGVIVTGFGTPPGGDTAYRATVLVTDPALDARSLKVSLLTQAGPASDETARAVEDAILTRARQLRSGTIDALR